MSALIEKTISGIRTRIFNWFVPIAGIDKNGNPQLIRVDSTGSLASISGLTPAAGSYDNIVLDPPAKPTTITYKLGETTVATLTLTYSGDDIETITRS